MREAPNRAKNCENVSETAKSAIPHPPHLRGGQAYHFGQKEFELGVGGEGQDTSRHFEGSFEFIRAKTGAKTKI